MPEILTSAIGLGQEIQTVFSGKDGIVFLDELKFKTCMFWECDDNIRWQEASVDEILVFS